jgi:hypothetical protein
MSSRRCRSDIVDALIEKLFGAEVMAGANHGLEHLHAQELPWVAPGANKASQHLVLLRRSLCFAILEWLPAGGRVLAACARATAGAADAGNPPASSCRERREKLG